MKNKRKILTIMLTTILVLLGACSNSTEESQAKLDNPSTNESNKDDSSNVVDDNSKQHDQEETNTTDNSSEDADSSEQHNHSSQTSTDTSSEESQDTNNPDQSTTEGMKTDYLTKLNQMEEDDRNSDVGTTTVELEEQEAERYKKWDEELNKIYGILKEQLSKEKMDLLREEQRAWIIERDELAEESSLKYKDGSMETLEYVATQATLTRERCYLLVAKYMK